MEKKYKSRKYIWKEVIFMIGETRYRVYDFIIEYKKEWISTVNKRDY